jgi:hypothetical protein
MGPGYDNAVSEFEELRFRFIGDEGERSMSEMAPVEVGPAEHSS